MYFLLPNLTNTCTQWYVHTERTQLARFIYWLSRSHHWFSHYHFYFITFGLSFYQTNFWMRIFFSNSLLITWIFIDLRAISRSENKTFNSDSDFHWILLTFRSTINLNRKLAPPNVEIANWFAFWAFFSLLWTLLFELTGLNHDLFNGFFLLSAQKCLYVCVWHNWWNGRNSVSSAKLENEQQIRQVTLTLSKSYPYTEAATSLPFMNEVVRESKSLYFFLNVISIRYSVDFTVQIQVNFVWNVEIFAFIGLLMAFFIFSVLCFVWILSLVLTTFFWIKTINWNHSICSWLKLSRIGKK